MDEETRAIVPLETSALSEVVPSAEALTARAAADQLAAQVVGLTALVEWMPKLGRTFDTAAAHEVLESMDAHKQLAERTSLLLASMKFTNEARWAEVVSAAMLTFSIAAIAAKTPSWPPASRASAASSAAEARRRTGKRRRTATLRVD